LLRANQFGVAKIELAADPNALVVPSQAVQQVENSPVVFVQTGPRDFKARTVRLGITSGQWTQIAAGISETDTIVVEGSHVLKSALRNSLTAATP
jgi:membrane fusion protein, heavy metal efflux system